MVAPVLPLIILITIVGEAKVAVAIMAVLVPVLYAVATKVLEFYVRWELKGRRSRREYRIWVEAEDDPQWECRTGNLEKLVAIHENGKKIAHVEQSVRFWNGNPYSLGLDLTAGAIAVDIASLMGGEGAPQYLAWAVLVHVLLLFVVFALVLSNQNAPPNEVWLMRITAALAILLGLLAMATSFLALDAGLVEGLLNLGGNR